MFVVIAMHNSWGKKAFEIVSPNPVYAPEFPNVHSSFDICFGAHDLFLELKRNRFYAICMRYELLILFLFSLMRDVYFVVSWG